MAGSRHPAAHVNAAAALRSVMLSALHNGRDKVTGVALARGGHIDAGEAMQLACRCTNQVAHPWTPSMQHPLDMRNTDSRSFQLHLQANRFESAGLDRRPAELLAQYITEVILLNKSKMDDNFVDKRHLDKASGGQLPVRPRWIRGKRDRQGGSGGREPTAACTGADRSETHACTF